MGDENNNIDLVNLAIAGVAATNPLLAFILMIGWHIQLFHVIPEKLGYCRGIIQKLTKRAEEKKDSSWKSKVAFGILKPIKVATGVLPEPPKNMEDVEQILKLCTENNDCINEELDKFLHGKYSPSEFIEKIKNILDAKTSVEALDLYINLKDIILDQKMFLEFDKIAARGIETKKDLEAKIEEISINFEKNLKNIETKILTLDEGFKIITPVFFYFYKRDESKIIDDWKKGWGLRLEDMQTELDYRRKIIDKIYKEGNFLILGESGYSKSTTLYRIIYDYCEKYYTVIASLGNDKIEHPQKIVKVIEDLLNEGNILVAIDNIQDENKIKAFEIIYALANHKNFERIKFVFSARLPNFEDIISYKKYVPKDTREAIDYSLENLMELKHIGNFDIEEAEGFVRKFYPKLYDKEIEEELFNKDLVEHFKLSNNGHPILLKYLLTGNGIEKDVKDKYLDYIVDKYTEKEKEARLKAVLFSCILDLCVIEITDVLASKCKVDLKLLKDSILKYNELTGTWEMMHHVWDIQFLIFWDSKSRKEEENPKETIKQIVDTILDLKDTETANKLIKGLANIVLYKKELFGLFEPSIKVPDYIDDAKKAQLYTSLGYMWYKLEDFYKSLDELTFAIMIFERLAEVNDESKNELAVAYNNRGVTYFYLEDYFEAIQDYNKAIEINPKDENTYVNRGNAYADSRDLEKAIQDYNKAIEINPKNAQAYYNRGFAYYNKGDWEKVIQDYSKVIEINPKATGAYNRRGNAYSFLGDKEKAIQDYNRAIEIDPNFAAAYYNRGNVYFDSEDWEKAIQDFNRAIEINPEYEGAYVNRGLAYHKKGDWEKAIQDYSKVIKINRRATDAYLNRGKAYLELGDKDKAIQDYRIVYGDSVDIQISEDKRVILNPKKF